MYNHNYPEKLVVYCINIFKCSAYNTEVVYKHCGMGDAGHCYEQGIQGF